MKKRLKNLLTLWKRPRPEVGTTPADVVHRENKWRLLRYHTRPQGLACHTPVLLIPSLINRHYVLDLMPGKSFAQYLVEQGHPVFIIDWGTPGPEDRYLTFDDICDTYLGRAIRRTASFSPNNKVHLMGYCMGGILATIHAAARPKHVASITALAAPINFTDEGLLATWTRIKSFDVRALTNAGNVPWQLMQPSFHMLKPTMNLTKTVGLLERAWDDQFLDGFLAIETWANDNVAFPAECYRRYIEDLYQHNKLYNGTFTLSGTPARLDQIHCPVLAITFTHDHIVPWHTAAALIDAVSSQDKEHIQMPGGHVGAVVSRKASKRLWPLISSWWTRREITG